MPAPTTSDSATTGTVRVDRDREADAGGNPPAQVHGDRGAAGMLTVSGSSAPPSSRVRIVAFVGTDARVGDRPSSASGRRTIDRSRTPSRVESSRRTERERQARATVGAVEHLRLLGDHPAAPGGHLGGDEIVPAGLVVHRHRDPAVAGHDEPLKILGRQRAGVGEEVDVDDRVVGERVEQREPELRAPHRRSRGEVPLRRGVARARTDAGVAVAGDRVRDDRPGAGHLDQHPRLGDRQDVRDPDAGERPAPTSTVRDRRVLRPGPA